MLLTHNCTACVLQPPRVKAQSTRWCICVFQTLRSHRRIPHQKARALTAALVLNAKFPQLHHSPKPNSLRVQRKRTAAHETLPLVVGRRKQKKKKQEKETKKHVTKAIRSAPAPCVPCWPHTPRPAARGAPRRQRSPLGGGGSREAPG